MQIKNSKLRDLYERYMNFINSNYIYAIVSETTNTVSISYPGELARIFIKVDNEISALVLKITQDPTKKMSNENGKVYYMATIDEMNNMIAASKVIMDLKIPEGAGNTSTTKLIETAADDQGYLLDKNKNMLGVVFLNRIPTNAYVYDEKEVNNEVHTEESISKPEERRKSIRRFFS